MQVEELVERSRGKLRAEVVHDRLRAMGFARNERTIRRAVAMVKTADSRNTRRGFCPSTRR